MVRIVKLGTPLKHPYYGSYRWNCSNYICAFLSWMNLEHAHHASSWGSNSDNLSPITPVLWGRSLRVFSKCCCLSHCIGLCHFPGPTRATSNTPQATDEKNCYPFLGGRPWSLISPSGIDEILCVGPWPRRNSSDINYPRPILLKDPIKWTMGQLFFSSLPFL